MERDNALGSQLCDQGQCIYIWGIHPVEEFLRHRPEAIRCIWVLPSFGKKKSQAVIMTLSERKGIQPERVVRFSEKWVPPGSVHQGIVALVEPVWLVDLASIQQMGQGGKQVVIVACDQVTDPHNLGSIIRSVAALSRHGILLLPKRSCARINGTVVKASSGLIVHVRICEIANLVRTLETLKKWGFWVYGLSPDGDQVLWQADLKGSILVVVGAEGRGLRRLTRKACDHMVEIPSPRPVDSLNVSVATAIFLYEALRQQRAEGV